jgi:Cdc6-like AAA superfamily ATPase
MNLTELRKAVGELADRARQGKGTPRRVDITEARNLWEQRTEHLSDLIPSNIALKYRTENQCWDSWPAIAETFSAYYAAIVELQNRMAIPLAEIRLTGV